MTETDRNETEKGTTQTVRFTATQAQALRRYLAVTNQKFQSFALRLILRAMASPEVVPPAQPRPHADVPPAMRSTMEKLARVLSSGDEKAIEAVIANIDLFVDRLRPAARLRKRS